MWPMTSSAHILVNQTYMRMKIKLVTNKRFSRILSPVAGSLISHVDFCLREEEGKEKEE